LHCTFSRQIGFANSKEFFNTPFLLVKKIENIQIGDSCGISAGASNMKSNQSVVGGLKNISFWSPLQKEIFENSEYSKVLFALHFGGGKSTLMKEKATQLAKQGKEVIFICMNGIDSNSNKSNTAQNCHRR
jgi:hypothetical protein